MLNKLNSVLTSKKINDLILIDNLHKNKIVNCQVYIFYVL